MQCGCTPNASSMNAETNSTPRESQSSILSETNTLRRKQTLDVWNHFKDGNWKAVCNYYGSKFLGESRRGTLHLRNHFKSCKLRTTWYTLQHFLTTTTTKNHCWNKKTVAGRIGNGLATVF